MLKLVLAVLLAGGVIGLSRLGWFGVRQVECRLNHYPCPLSLEPVLINFVGQNIFRLNPRAVVRQLSQFDPTLTEIKVKRQLPGRLRLDLVKRQPLAVIKTSDQTDSEDRRYLDKTGFVYWPPPADSQALPEVRWPAELPLAEGESDLSRDLAALINTLAAYYVSFDWLTRLTEPAYLVKTSAGPQALIPAGEDFSGRVGSLQFILSNIKIGESVPGQIDLRFDQPVLTY